MRRCVKTMTSTKPYLAWTTLQICPLRANGAGRLHSDNILMTLYTRSTQSIRPYLIPFLRYRAFSSSTRRIVLTRLITARWSVSLIHPMIRRVSTIRRISRYFITCTSCLMRRLWIVREGKFELLINLFTRSCSKQTCSECTMGILRARSTETFTSHHYAVEDWTRYGSLND